MYAKTTKYIEYFQHNGHSFCNEHKTYTSIEKSVTMGSSKFYAKTKKISYKKKNNEVVCCEENNENKCVDWVVCHPFGIMERVRMLIKGCQHP